MLCYLELPDSGSETLDVTVRLLGQIGDVSNGGMLPIAPPLAGSLLVPDTGCDASSTACSAYGLHAVTLAFPVATLITGQSRTAPLPAFGLGRLGRGSRRRLGCHCQRERTQKRSADKFSFPHSNSLYDANSGSTWFLETCSMMQGTSRHDKLDDQRTNPRSPNCSLCSPRILHDAPTAEYPTGRSLADTFMAKLSNTLGGLKWP